MRKTLAVLGWAAVAVLAFCYASITAFYGWLSLEKVQFLPYWAWAYILFALFLLLAVPALRRFRKHRRDRKCILRGTLLLLFAAPLAVLLVDAPPPEHEYTEADVRPSDPAVLASYGTCMQLRQDGGVAMNVNDPLVSQKTYERALANPSSCAADIRRLWNDTAAARKVVETLDAFPGICEISADQPLFYGQPIPSLMKLRTLVRSYSLYARLKAAEGDTREAARQIALLHRVARKWLRHAGEKTMKLYFISVVKQDTLTAKTILDSPGCDAETLAILKENFPPLSAAELSMRRTCLLETVFLKNLLRRNIPPVSFTSGDKPHILDRAANAPVIFFLLQTNRTLRLKYEMTSLLLAADGRLPADYSACDAMARHIIQTRPVPLRNACGHRILTLTSPSFGISGQTLTSRKILGDLLCLEICRKRGEPLPELDDPYTKKPYAADAKGRFFSPGPDGKPDTADDIRLEP